LGQAIPDYPVDLFSHESVRNARAVDDAVREFSPVVRLADGTVMITRHADVVAGLGEWQTYSSRSRPWHDPKSLRPEILLTDDPPRHTHVRQVMAKVLSAQVVARARPALERDAALLIDELLAQQGEVVDAVRDITQRFVYKALPDAIGLRVAGREHMYAFSHMVWATMGPENALFREAMVNLDPVLAWLEQCCDRDNLAAGGIGLALYALADEGTITQAEAKLLLQTVLAAGADTTILTLANALQALALFPEQFRKIQADPGLVRAAFDESLRWDSPSRMAGRITTREVEIGGYTVPAGQRVGLMFAAANRDPRAWPDPDQYEIGRDLRNQVGWGYGVHACVGRVLAQVEAQVLLSEVARRVSRIEMAGTPEPWMTTIGHGPAKLPIRLYGH
jgi:4-methoxybenzoate monooxygenase (O-demethylating)